MKSSVLGVPDFEVLQELGISQERIPIGREVSGIVKEGLCYLYYILLLTVTLFNTIPPEELSNLYSFMKKWPSVIQNESFV